MAKIVMFYVILDLLTSIHTFVLKLLHTYYKSHMQQIMIDYN